MVVPVYLLFITEKEFVMKEETGKGKTYTVGESDVIMLIRLTEIYAASFDVFVHNFESCKQFISNLSLTYQVIATFFTAVKE